MAETRTFPHNAPGDVVEQRFLGADAGFRYFWDLEVTDAFGNAQWKPHRYDIKTGELVLDTPINWMELPGSQADFLKCPIFECLYHGTRGSGKSIILLMDFAREVGKGYGKSWRGVLFRKTFGDLDDIVRKIDDTFPIIYPNFRFLRSKSEYKCEWPDGEALLLRHLESEKDYDCLDEGEVLTPTGWCDIREIQIGDPVYEVSPTGELVDSIVTQKHEYDIDDELIRHRGRGAYMSFTPNHRLGVLKDGLITPTRYDEGGRRMDVARSVSFSGGKRIDSFMGIEGDLFCEFMGWFLSEGSALQNVSTASNKHVFYISQSKKENRKKIELFLIRMGLNFSKTDAYFRMKNKEWWTYLVQFGHCREKFIPDIIKQASVAQLNIFFQAIMAGDGTWQGKSGYYYSSSKRLADDVSEVAVKLGYPVYVSSRQRDNRKGLSWCVACRGSRMSLKILTDDYTHNMGLDGWATNITREHFVGKVYCIGVPKHHMFVVRQQGSIHITGNSYHGHEYPWLGFEELTQWENDKAYKLMFSCCRPTAPGIPCRVRATTNPSGSGHGWVKKRFLLPQKNGVLISNPNEVPRIAIRGVLSENFVMLHTAPNYPQQIVQAATNPAQADAWLTGNWDVNAGGMFDDVWDSRVHILPNFPAKLIPSSWRITRSYDHGQSRPFSVGWWLESTGEPVKFNGIEYGAIRGDLILFSEWYGTDGSDPNVGLRMFAPDIAQGIIDREEDLGLQGRVMSLGGPADTEIWSKDQRGTGRAPIDDMNDMGVYWEKADKTPGSRARGWQMIRSYLANAKPHRDGTRDKPGMFVCARCSWWIDLVPKAPRSEKDMDDIPDKYPDHSGDMTRYRVNWQIPGMFRTSF